MRAAGDGLGRADERLGGLAPQVVVLADCEALAPAALLLFSQVSIVGPLANAVAIPVVSVVVT